MREMDIAKLVVASGKIKKCVQKSVNDLLKPYAISSVHAPYLLLLLHHKQLTRKGFNEFLNVDKSNTTRVIQDLEQHQMITYDDKARNGHIYLTEKGLEVATMIDEWMLQRKQFFLEKVKEEDLKIFLSVLKDIIKVLEGE